MSKVTAERGPGRNGGRQAGPGAPQQKRMPGPSSHSRGSLSALCFGGSLSSSKTKRRKDIHLVIISKCLRSCLRFEGVCRLGSSDETAGTAGVE